MEKSQSRKGVVEDPLATGRSGTKTRCQFCHPSLRTRPLHLQISSTHFSLLQRWTHHAYT
jgi:hypothetical protein